MKLTPEFFSSISRGSINKSIKNDTISGITVGIVALPLAVAFAIASGVKPEQGIYTAIIAGFIISFLGGSRVQIGGPTGAFIVVVFGIVQKFGYEGLAVSTIMAGVFLVGLGLLKLGTAIKFIPYPMTVGFTTGIALIIASTQIDPLLGLHIPEKGEGLFESINLTISYISTFNSATMLIGIASLVIIIIWPRITKKIPGSIVAIVVMTILVTIFDLSVETIGTKFGDIPSGLPELKIPKMDIKLMIALIPYAITIAILGAIESLLSAVVADGMTGTRHRSNIELVAQGVANIVTPLFGGIPATGAIARTATNIKNGGTTPIAGMVHAFTLLMILIVFGRWASMIPLSTLAAILLVVAYHMSEWKVFVKLLQSPKYDIVVMMITFLLTIFVDLTVAIEVGIVSSALLFMYRMSNLVEINNIKNELNENFSESDDFDIVNRIVPEGVEVFEIYGPFFFGAANRFKDTISIVQSMPEVLILRMRSVMTIDTTAMRALEDVYTDAKKNNTVVIFSGISDENIKMLNRFKFTDTIGKENILTDIDSALDRANEILKNECIC